MTKRYQNRTWNASFFFFFYCASAKGRHIGAVMAARGCPFQINVCSSWAITPHMGPSRFSGHHRNRPRDNRFWHNQNP
jgi:hypothetical protein